MHKSTLTINKPDAELILKKTTNSLNLGYYLPLEQGKIGAAAKTGHFFETVQRNIRTAAT